MVATQSQGKGGGHDDPRWIGPSWLQLATVKAHHNSELSFVLHTEKGWIRIEHTHTHREREGSGGTPVRKGGMGLEGVDRPMESGCSRGGGGERGVRGRCGTGVD